MKKNICIIVLILIIVCSLCLSACCNAEKQINIKLNKTEVTLTVGQTDTLVATTENASPDSVKWSSSNSAAVSVDRGKLTALAEGSAVITASIGKVVATCSVTVNGVNTVVTPEKWQELLKSEIPANNVTIKMSFSILSKDDEGNTSATDGREIVKLDLDNKCCYVFMADDVAEEEGVVVVSDNLYFYNKTNDGDWTRITEELSKDKSAEELLLLVLQDFIVDYTAYISFGRNSYTSFHYDEVTKSYTAENLSSKNDNGDEVTLAKVVYKFQNEKLLRAEFENGLFYLIIELSDYGTTVVNVPKEFTEE